VDVFVRKLRQKLEHASPRWRYIHTHVGVGYRFAAEALDEEMLIDVQALAGPGEPGKSSQLPADGAESALLRAP
jgi:hypothetical protein